MWGKLAGGVSSALNKASGGATNVDGLSGEALTDALDVAVDADAVLDLYSQVSSSQDRATVLSCALERLVVAHTRVAERHVEQLLLAISTRQGGSNHSSGDRAGDEIYQATNVLLACIQSQPNREIVKRQSDMWLSNQEAKMNEKANTRTHSSPLKGKSVVDPEQNGGEQQPSVQELVIQSLPDDADCLLSLIRMESSHGFWVRYTVTQLLKEMVAVDHLYPGDPFLNLLMRSTSGIGSIVEVLDDTSNDGILRAEGIQLLLAFATKVYSTTEYESQVQSLFAFENIFDRLLSIVKDCGGSASLDIAHVTTSRDCAQIVAWLVSSSRLAGQVVEDDEFARWSDLEDDAATAASASNAVGHTVSQGIAIQFNEKVIDLFLKMDHIKALVPLLHVPGTDSGKEVVLFGLQILDCVLRAALGVDLSVGAQENSKPIKSSEITASKGVSQLVDPHTFRPSVVSSKVFTALCQLLPMHSMLSGARIEQTKVSDDDLELRPSVLLLQEVARSIMRKDVEERYGDKVASTLDGESDEEALCLVLRCLHLVTEDCASGREHLLHPKSPVFPMLTAMSSSLPGKIRTVIKKRGWRFKHCRFSGHLAMGLFLQLLSYLDGVRGTTPIAMLEMVIAGLGDVLSMFSLPENFSVVPPLLTHRLIHFLFRLNSAVHSIESKMKVEADAFSKLSGLILNCGSRIASLSSTVSEMLAGQCAHDADLLSVTANYYLEPLLLSTETYCNYFTHSESSTLMPLSLKDDGEDKKIDGIDIRSTMKAVLELDQKLKQLPSSAGRRGGGSGGNDSDDEIGSFDSGSRNVTSLLACASMGLLLVHSVQGAHSVTNTSGYTTPVIIPTKNSGSGPHQAQPKEASSSKSDTDYSTTLLVEGMESAVFNVAGQDDWYSSAYFQLFHRTNVDSSAGSTITSTTTATTAMSTMVGASVSLGGFLVSVLHNLSGSTPDGWLALLVQEDEQLSSSLRGLNLMRQSSNSCPFSSLNGPAKDTVKRLCENGFAVYFSKKRAQFVQQMGEMRNRAGAMALTSDAQKYQRLLQEAELKNRELTAEVDRLRAIVDEQSSHIAQLTEEQDSLCESLFETKQREQKILRALQDVGKSLQKGGENPKP